MKFTDASIRNLRPRESRYIEWKDNGGGLGVRVSPKGRKTFVYMYRFDGKPRMMTLGTYPRTSVAQANKLHGDAAAALEEGKDPGAEKIEQRKAERDAESVEALIELYIDKYAKIKKKSWKEDERILNREVKPEWGKKKAKNIHRRDVIKLLDEIADRGAPIQANRTLAVIRKMYNFAIKRGIMESSPCVQIDPPGKEKAKDRYLTADEIKNFWNKLPATDMPETAKLAVKMILVTGQRPGEVTGMRKDEIDGDWWDIPAERTKNGLPHRVFLSDLAQEIIEQAEEYNDGKEHVFPSPRKGEGYDKDGLPQFVRRNLSTLEVDPFTPHDLRRTAATYLHEMGFPTHLVSKLLNHKDKGVTGLHYNRYEYANEKQQALEAWDRRLTAILKGIQSNIVSMVKA